MWLLFQIYIILKHSHVKFRISIILKDVFFTMKLRRIGEEHQEAILAKSVFMFRVNNIIMSALQVIIVPSHTIELKSSTILKSTKSNFVKLILKGLNLAIMGTCVLSLMLKMKCRLTCLINLIKMQIFICSISRQYGALTLIPLIQGTNAFMLIIGKILGENLISMTMKKNNVHLGKLKTSYRLMQMDVKVSTDVNSLMDGKSKSIIHSITRCMLADKMKYAKNLIAHIITQNKIEDTQSINILNCFQRIEEPLPSKLRYIRMYS